MIDATYRVETIATNIDEFDLEMVFSEKEVSRQHASADLSSERRGRAKDFMHYLVAYHFHPAIDQLPKSMAKRKVGQLGIQQLTNRQVATRIRST